MQASEPQAGETLERMLARYARVRLEPSPTQVRAARNAVMDAVWLRQGAADAAELPAFASPAQLAPIDAPRAPIALRRRPFSGWGLRRLGTAMTAAALVGLLAGSATFASTRAGGPLYDARLALEVLVLPSDPDARVEAEIAQAQGRLAEVVDAASRQDQGALDAALTAYERVVNSLATSTGGPADRAMEAVAAHQAVLERVMATAPAEAQAGLAHAVANGLAAVEHLSVAGSPGGPSDPGASDPGGRPTAKPEASTKPKPTTRPEASTKPGASGKPDASSKPKPTQKPKPDTTPKPKPTPSAAP